jgi:hypothetical protein
MWLTKGYLPAVGNTVTSRGFTGASGAVFVAELELLLRKIQLGLAMPKYVVKYHQLSFM